MMPIKQIPNLGSVGLNTDVGPTALPDPAWTSCNHVVTRNGKAIRAWDAYELWSLPIEPVYRFSYRSSTNQQYLIISDGNRVFAIQTSGATEEITPAGATPSRFVTFCNLNGVLVFNSLARGPCYWPGPGDVLTDLPGWQPTWKCEGMASYKYYLVAWGMHESSVRYEHKIRWSSAAPEGNIPGEWLPTPTNDAGDDILGETSGALIGSRLVQDALWLIKEDAIYAVTYIGQPFILQSRRLNGRFNVSSEEATIEYKGALILLSGADVYYYDGAATRSLTEGKVGQDLRQKLDQFGLDKAKLFLTGDNRYLFVLASPVGSHAHSSALVLELETGAWGHMQLDNSYGFENMRWEDSGAGNTTEKIVSLHGSGTWEASEMKLAGPGSGEYVSRIERTALPVMGAPMLAMTTEAWLEVDGGASFSLYLLSSEVPTGSRKTDGPHTINSAVQSSIHPRVTGRYAGYRIETTARTGWELESLFMRQEPAGER